MERHITFVDLNTQHSADGIFPKLTEFGNKDTQIERLTRKDFLDIDKIILKFIWKINGL